MAPRHHTPRTRRDADVIRYTAEEIGHRRPDFARRANLRADIDAEIAQRDLTSVEAYRALGLATGVLSDNSLSTERLHEVLDALRAMPGGFHYAPFVYEGIAGPGWDAPNLAALLGGPSPGLDA